ncbi:hypothetical protein WJS89_03085 [Sphingomicrobium sp. XHP0235]|uniref:hypothetical protein n=1 Tax=Sphingomicrobium aquimarinum TaxID=3133971 RepID=UPI0031FEEBF0
MKRILALTAAAAAFAAPAAAQDKGFGGPDIAFEEMMAGNYDAAERKLLQSARTDVGARINLAQVFAMKGKEREALILLRSVKDNDDIALEGAEGEILSSHRVADVLLARMGESPAYMASAER